MILGNRQQLKHIDFADAIHLMPANAPELELPLREFDSPVGSADVIVLGRLAKATHDTESVRHSDIAAMHARANRHELASERPPDRDRGAQGPHGMIVVAIAGGKERDDAVAFRLYDYTPVLLDVIVECGMDKSRTVRPCH